MMDLYKADRDELWSVIQQTFMQNPTREAMQTLTTLVDSLAQLGGLPYQSTKVWREWAEKIVR